VDRQDKLASFSSRGPRLGDAAPKPEITAPGVGIVAARATGTSMGAPVDNHYTAASGTSMATPHVAGAAALLAEKHPEWRARELKAALVASARDAGDHWYQAGSGRLDVARALGASVQAAASVSLGISAAGSEDPLDQIITYSNRGGRPVTIYL